VEAKFVHLSLRSVADPQLRNRLLAIPTGLTLSPEDADALIAAGRGALLHSRDIKALIDSL
jgi:hypothetical protein